MGHQLREVSLHMCLAEHWVFFYRINPRTGKYAQREYHVKPNRTHMLCSVLRDRVRANQGQVIPNANGWQYFDSE